MRYLATVILFVPSDVKSTLYNMVHIETPYYTTFYLWTPIPLCISTPLTFYLRPLNKSRSFERFIRYDQKQDLYIGKYPLKPLFDTVFSESYEIHLCLPENAVLKETFINIPLKGSKTYKDFGYLEMYGKPCYVFEFENVWPALYDPEFSFVFGYDQ